MSDKKTAGAANAHPGIIDNLPVVMAASTAAVAGLYGYINGLPNTRVYQNMCLFLIVFYLIGAFLKHTYIGLRDEFAERAEAAKSRAALAEAAKEGAALPEAEKSGAAAAAGLPGIEAITPETEGIDEGDAGAYAAAGGGPYPGEDAYAYAYGDDEFIEQYAGGIGAAGVGGGGAGETDANALRALNEAADGFGGGGDAGG